MRFPRPERRSSKPSRVPEVRRADPGDRRAVMATVAAAFAQDPAWAFILGDEYDRLAPHFADALFRGRVGPGGVWVTDDVSAVAMWEPPRDAPRGSGHGGEVWDAYRALAGEPAWQRLGAYDQALDEVRPTDPHWYLGVLATRPDRQGEGLASAVLAPVIALADGRGLACCLETSTTGNRAFYARRGFTEAIDVRIESGPPTWWLRRAPPRPS